MANIPTVKEADKLIAKSEAQDNRKAESQAKQGKEFVNSGQGVIPESAWKNLPGKKIEDETAVA